MEDLRRSLRRRPPPPPTLAALKASSRPLTIPRRGSALTPSSLSSPGGLGLLSRRDRTSTPEICTFAELAAEEGHFFAETADLRDAATLLRLHNIQAVYPGEQGLREGLALIAWVDIHLFLADDWEDLPHPLRVQLLLLLNINLLQLEDNQDCIQRLRLQWMLNLQQQCALGAPGAETIPHSASELDGAAHDLAGWLDIPNERRTPLRRLSAPPRPGAEDMEPPTPADRASQAEAERRSQHCDLRARRELDQRIVVKSSNDDEGSSSRQLRRSHRGSRRDRATRESKEDRRGGDRSRSPRAREHRRSSDHFHCSRSRSKS